jgi:hypothetical protein
MLEKLEWVAAGVGTGVGTGVSLGALMTKQTDGQRDAHYLALSSRGCLCFRLRPGLYPAKSGADHLDGVGLDMCDVSLV